MAGKRPKFSRRPRASVVALAGLFVAAAVLSAGAIMQSHMPPNRTAVFIGDSYTAGPGKWPTAVSRVQGWREINLGRGGTGFRYRPPASSSQSACGLAACPNFNQMVPLVVKTHPDVVVVAGGRNDGGRDIKADVNTLFTRLRAGLPRAKIIAVEPLWDSSEYPPFMVDYGTAIREAVQKVGGTYVECGQPLKGQPNLVQPDGVHPTAAGQEVIADAINEYLERSGG